MANSMLLLMLVLPDEGELAGITTLLEQSGLDFELRYEQSYERALERLRSAPVDAVIAAGRIAERSAMTFVVDAGTTHPHLPVLLLIDDADPASDPDLAIELIEAGAADALVSSSLTAGSLRQAIRAAIARRGRLETMRRGREQYQAAWEYSNDAIAILNSDGKIFSANPAFYRIFHYSPADVLGRHFTELFSTEERSARIQAFRQNFERGVSVPLFETSLSSATGERRVIEAQADFIMNGSNGVAMLVVARDITERKVIEEALKKSEEQFRLLIEQALDIITILEVDGIIRFQSPAVKRVLGYEIEELVGQNAFSYIHEDDLPNVLSVFMDALNTPGATRRVEYRFLHSDGSWRFLETLGTNLTHDPHIAGVVVNSRDVTERRHAEQELQEANDRLETRVHERTSEIVAVMAKLEEAHMQQQQFVANASHDIRTPLAVIRTEIDLFGYGTPGPEKIAATLQRIAGEVKVLERLAEDLLMLATIDRQKPAVCYDRIRLDEFLLECIARLTQISIEKNIAWDIQIEEPIELQCDSGSLERAITNVLNNAIKYSRANGIVCVALLAGDDGMVTIEIGDEGVGIPENDLPRVFDRFYRGDYARNTEGTGLGLAIVRGIVEAHGGSVAIESTVGKGTKVTIMLPASRSSAEGSRAGGVRGMRGGS